MNEMVELNGCDDEGVEGFNDNKDEVTLLLQIDLMELMFLYPLMRVP